MPATGMRLPAFARVPGPLSRTAQRSADAPHVRIQRPAMKPSAAPKQLRKATKPRPATAKPAARPTLFEQFKAFDGLAGDLPTDLAAQHDHYLYGLKKRPV
jgi:hypothetical protein